MGPYQVVERTSKGNYILQELDGTIHAEKYAGFRLIPYISRNSHSFQQLMHNNDTNDTAK